MIVDSSALTAVVLREPDARRYFTAMVDASQILLPAPAFVESMMVATRVPDGPLVLRQILEQIGATVVAFGAEHAERAVDAFAAYGRGSGHPARLNFGDCMVYAVASVENRPLLYKGDDFSSTDVTPALGKH